MDRKFQGLLALLSAFLIAGCIGSRAEATDQPVRSVKVMVLATLHGGHADNPRYPYEDVYSLVETFDPDILGVEIRSEDLDRGEDYLAANYPLEMRELARRYPNRTVGIDWLGEELEGRPVPRDYWRSQSQIIRLQRELGEHDLIRSTGVEAAKSRQREILDTATSSSLNDGRYDLATTEYYSALASLLKDTRYSKLTDFYKQRDRQIAENAAAAIQKLQNVTRGTGRVLLVVGADHRGPVVEALKLRFEDEIQFVPVP